MIKKSCDPVSVIHKSEETGLNPLLAKYCSMVDFLAEVLGKDAEVVLHDVEDIDHSVVAIRNGYISGRAVGSPATNVILKIMKDDCGDGANFLSNYRGVSADGKTLRSSSYFIRDDERRLIGILCVNIDSSKFEQFRDYLDGFLGLPPQGLEADSTVERFSNSVEDLALDSIENVIEESGVPPKRMSLDEKIAIVKKLNDNGVFLLKGAISRVAAKLNVSEATVYRYLNGIKKEGS